MNYSKAFSYVFDDQNWLSKLLIAGLISLIPIVGQLYLLGWMVEIVRRVKAGRTDVLPTTHFSYFLTLGLKMFVVALIYSIPVIILSCILNLITGAAGKNDTGFFTVIFAGFGCVGGILTIVIQIAVALLGTYGTIKLAETDQIKACLNFNEAFSMIKNNLSTFIIVELLAIVAGLIQSAGVIICIGIILTAPYGTAIIGNLVGQLWDNLKPYDSNEKPFRGSVNKSNNDIIEEAPFTMVQDIEKDAGNSWEDIKDVTEETAAAEAEIIEEISEDITVTAETPEPETEEPVEAETDESAADVPEEEKPESNDDSDIPSFE